MSFFNYYVIHMKDRIERYDNIKLMEQKLKQPIEIFFGINGNDINDTKITNFDKKLQIKKKFNLKGQLGCYLSHFLLLNEIYKKNTKYDYTVIFEDDFDIIIDDLDNKITEAIKKIDIDVDFLFLGIEGFAVGKNYKDNLYFINNNLKTWGFQGYVVKNKNINRILEHLYNIYFEVDIQLFRAIKCNLLNGLFISPNYVNQNKNLISIIRPKEKVSYKCLLLKKQVAPLINKKVHTKININNTKNNINKTKNNINKKKISYIKPLIINNKCPATKKKIIYTKQK